VFLSEIKAYPQVLWLPGFQVLWLPGFQVLWLPGFQVLWLPGFLAPGEKKPVPATRGGYICA